TRDLLWNEPLAILRLAPRLVESLVGQIRACARPARICGMGILSPLLGVVRFNLFRSKTYFRSSFVMFLAFGEIMLRVAPEGHLRFRQVLPGRVDMTFAGAEANVCAALAMWGQSCRYLTAIPSNVVTEALVTVLRGLGIDTQHLVL